MGGFDLRFLHSTRQMCPLLFVCGSEGSGGSGGVYVWGRVGEERVEGGAFFDAIEECKVKFRIEKTRIPV